MPQEFRGKPQTLKQQVDWCWQNWQPPEEEKEEEKSVLLVLDDVTEVTNWENCQDFLPKINRFRILVTTRLRNLDTNFVELPLGVLSPGEALELLTALVSKRRIHKELQTAKELCKWLGYLPLGLELVGRYLRKDPDLSLAEMLERLKRKSLEDKAINPSNEQLQNTEMTAKRGVKAALELSWQRQELDAMTQRVGELLSLFAPDIIPWELVKSVTELLNWGESEVNEAKNQLYERHLIQQVEERDACYKIHSLIREFLQAKLAVLEQVNDLKQAFVQVMEAVAKKISYPPSREILAANTLTIPHLEEAAKILKDLFSHKKLSLEQLKDSIILPTKVYEIYWSQARHENATQFCLQALEFTKYLMSEDNEDVAELRDALSILYYLQDRLCDAEIECQQALEIRRRLRDKNDVKVASSLSLLARIKHKNGDTRTAENLYKEAWEIVKKQQGENIYLVLDVLNSIGGFYLTENRYEAAEKVYQKALELCRLFCKDLGKEIPAIAVCLYNLALVYEFEKRYEKALSSYVEALMIYDVFLEESHPAKVRCQDRLASCLKEAIGAGADLSALNDNSSTLIQEIRAKVLAEIDDNSP